MLPSFWIAVSGLKTNNRWLDITSDNIANANTIGYKSSKPIFQDLIMQDVMQYNAFDNSVNHAIYGGGVTISSVYTNFSQGALQNTGLNTDIAIEGSGFLMVQNSLTGATYYTRDGQLSLTQKIETNGDTKVYLTHDTGLYVLGKNLTTGAIEPVAIDQIMPPKATTEVYAAEGSNLEPNQDVPTVDFDPTDATTFNSQYTLTIYDTQGNTHDLGIFFKKVNPKLVDDQGNTYYTFLLTDNNDTTYFAYQDNGSYYEAQAVNLANVDPTAVNLIDVATNVTILNPVGDEIKANIYWYIDENNQFHTVAEEINENGNPTGIYYELGTSQTQLTDYTQEPIPAQVSNYWETFVMLKGSDGKWYDIVSTQNNQVLYKPDGQLDTENGYQYALISFNNGQIVGDSYIDVDYQNLTLPGNLQNYLQLKGVNLNGLTQYAGGAALQFNQDGYSTGLFTNISISQNGTVTAIYSNGQTKDVYQLQLAYFRDLQSLNKVSGNLFEAAPGQNPLITDAGTMSQIKSGYLELSNVDIATELINMITAQKAYQANAKVITTDQAILDTTLNLIR